MPDELTGEQTESMSPVDQPQPAEYTEGQEPVQELEEGQAPEIEISPDQYQEQIQGLQTGISEERKKRQDAERVRDELAYRLSFMEQHYQQPQHQQQPTQPQYNDGDYVGDKTLGELREMLKGEIGGTIDSLKNEITQSKLIQSRESARARYPDYDEVFQKYVYPEAQRNPALLQAILTSPDPASTAYQFGCGSPEYREKIRKQSQERGAQKISQQIQKNSKQPSTLTAKPSAGNKPLDEVMKWRQASDEELLAEYERLKKEN